VTIRNGVPAASNADVDPSFVQRFVHGDRIIIGSICNLIEQKGLDWLLHVARDLHSQGLRVRFLIAGDGPLRDELLRTRDRMGLGDVVELLGRVPNAAGRLLPIFDIYFQPSRWEAMSMSLLEAMMAGKPVVSTDVGEARHMITSGDTGTLVEPGDVPSMASALRELIAAPALRLRMGEAARTAAASRFSESRMVQAYEDLYEKVMAK
jgi:glycosyltransferase involved in cell wall biosynthesis